MSILDVTEDQIFHTLGKGRDPNFKPIEKVRPVVVKPNKTYSINRTIKTAQTMKNTQLQAPQPAVEPVKPVPPFEADESMKKLTEDLKELNDRVAGIHKMVKWYIVPQFVVFLVLFMALVLKS